MKHWHAHVSRRAHAAGLESFFTDDLTKIYERLQSGDYDADVLDRVVIQNPLLCNGEHNEKWISLDTSNDGGGSGADIAPSDGG